MAANVGANASRRAEGDTKGHADTATTGSVRPENRCPVCEAGYESVSIHETGLMVNLLDNERYRRVCFEPVGEDGPRIRFYHHTHEQAALSE